MLKKRLLFYATVLSALSVFLIFLIDRTPNLQVSSFFSYVDYMLRDNFYAEESDPNHKIMVIGIDEATLEKYGAWNSWTRDRMAQLIDKLNENPTEKPSVIGIDVMYFGYTAEEYDKTLAKAVEESGNVVVASQLIFGEEVSLNERGTYDVDVNAFQGMGEPYPELKAISKQGHINVTIDADGIVRKNLHTFSNMDVQSNSFAYEIAKLYAEKENLELKLPDSSSSQMLNIAYKGNPGDYYSGLSFEKVLSGEIPSSYFKDAIVLIGPYAPGMLDEYSTSVDRVNKMYGVEIHANMIQALLEGNFKLELSNSIQLIIIGLLVWIGYVAFYLLEYRKSFICLIVLCGGYLAAAYGLYQAGYIIKLLYVPLFLLLFYSYRVLSHYLVERKRRQTITQTFKKYMAPQVVEQLIKDEKVLPTLSSEKRDIAVLFVDIRGFTSMSEKVQPEEVVDILNVYLDIITKSVYKYEGTIDKYIGDAAMVLFNAPFDQEAYEFKAVQTAVQIRESVEGFQEELSKKYGTKVACGVGVNCGPAIIGNIGSTERMDYTAIGDTVNTAARLESRAQRGQILISETMYERVKDKIDVRFVEEMELKGKKIPIKVYEVLSVRE